MATKKIYVGSFGPFIYDDTADINDADGDFSGETLQAIRSDGAAAFDGDLDVAGDLSVTGDSDVTGSVSAASFDLADTDASHHLSLVWNEDDSADRILNLLVAGADRSLTLNENFTIGDGFAGTLTFGSVCTLTVELNSVLNQDLTTDASPTFANLDLGTGELTTGSINRAADTLTLEIGGVAILSIYATAVLASQILSLADCPHLETDPDKFLVLEPNDQVYYRTGAEVLSDIGAAIASHAMSTHSDEDTYDILTSGTLGAGNATLGTVNALTLTAAAVGFTIAGGTTSKTLTADDNFVFSTQLAAIAANTAKVTCNFTNIQTALAAATGAVAFNSQNLTGVGAIGCGNITSTGTVGGTTAKLTNLTDGYIPYHVSDASGLANSILYTASNRLGVGTTTLQQLVTIASTSVTAVDIVADSDNNDADTDVLIRFYIDGVPATGVQKGKIAYDQGLNVLALGYGNNNDLVITSSGYVGIGITNPQQALNVASPDSVAVDVIADVDNNSGDSDAVFRFYIDGAPGTGTQKGRFGYDQGLDKFTIGYGNETNDLVIDSSGKIGIETTSPSAKLHVDQSSTTAAIPVLILDQADDSEEMIEFVGTIGVGNAIEAVDGKTLTTTHFIKCTLPGSLTIYLPVGTIA